MNIPKKISPSPIVEAVTEIRFENELPSAVIFGKLFGALSDEFGETEPLPIIGMPRELMDKEEFKFAPHYRLKNDRFLVNIGQRIISVNRICTKEEYTNWNDYYKIINSVFGVAQKAKLFETVERISVRYINFFDHPISSVLNFDFNLFNEKVSDFQDLTLSFTRKLENNNGLGVTIGSNATVQFESQPKKGLVVNFEAFKEQPVAVADMLSNVDDLHAIVEQGFFSSLDKAFLASLEPVYDA